MCDSYESFKKGNCAHCNKDGNYCIKFGFHSRPSYRALFNKGYYSSEPIATYLMTNEKQPFCAAHFKITLKVSFSEESRRHGGEIGILFLRPKSGNKEFKKMQFNPHPVYFEPGTNHTYLTIGEDVQDISTIMVEYRFKQTLNPLTWRIFTPRVYIEFIEIESMEHNWALKVCPHHQLPVR